VDRKASFNLWYVIAAIGGVLLLQYFMTGQRTTEQLAYSEFMQQLDAGNIEELTVTESRMRGKFREPLESGAEYFATYRVAPDVAAKLEEHNVRFAGDTEETVFGTLLSWVLPALFFVGLWYFLFRRVFARGGKIGRASCRERV